MNIDRMLDTVDDQIDSFDDMINRMEYKYREEFQNSKIAKDNGNTSKALMFANTCRVIRENINGIKDTKYYYQQIKIVFEMLNEKKFMYKSLKRNNAILKHNILSRKKSRELSKNLRQVTDQSAKFLNELNANFGQIGEIIEVQGNTDDLKKLIDDLNAEKIKTSDAIEKHEVKELDGGK